MGCEVVLRYALSIGYLLERLNGLASEVLGDLLRRHPTSGVARILDSGKVSLPRTFHPLSL